MPREAATELDVAGLRTAPRSARGEPTVLREDDLNVAVPFTNR